MVNFVKSPSVIGFGFNKITPAQIRKYFPKNCPDCPVGNLQLRHPPFVPAPTTDKGGVF